MNSLAFYETVAQIIPILVVVFVVEQRIFESEREGLDPLRAIFGFAAVGVMIIGEVFALRVLQTEAPYETAEDWTESGLLVGTSYVIGFPALLQARRLHTPLPSLLSLTYAGAMVVAVAEVWAT